MSDAADTQRISVKVYAEKLPSLTELVPVLHGWIQRRRLDEMAIDVADYRHVQGGPGVLLVCDAAHYAFDTSDGRDGLLYAHKRGDLGATLDERLAAGLRRALTAARFLEEDTGGRARFLGGEWRLRLDDRLLAPNTSDTWRTVEPALRALAARLHGSVALEHHADRRELLSATVRGPASDVASLLAKLS